MTELCRPGPDRPVHPRVPTLELFCDNPACVAREIVVSLNYWYEPGPLGGEPGEALRVGADAFASELNPVAVLLGY